MDFESSSNKFNKVNAVRRKRIGSFVYVHNKFHSNSKNNILTLNIFFLQFIFATNSTYWFIIISYNQNL